MAWIANIFNVLQTNAWLRVGQTGAGWMGFALCTWPLLIRRILLRSGGDAGISGVLLSVLLSLLLWMPAALAAPVCYVLLLLRMKPRRLAELSDKMTKRTCMVLSILALIVCVALGQGGNYVKLIRDQQDGTHEAYIAQFKNEYALLRTGGEADEVVIPAWTVQTVTVKPTAEADPTMWTNESMALYFGVAGVRVGE